MSPLLETSASEALWQRAVPLIPAGTQTLAKGPGQLVRGVAPKYAWSGRGARVTDVDGNSFVDWQMGIGPLVLGYCDPDVDEAITDQLAQGITFSLMHPLEVEVAERIHRLIPGAEQVRFGKNGCDVTTAAVRLARAFTGRDHVLMCGYHGWHDWSIAVTDRHLGIPDAVRDLTWTFPYNDLDAIERVLDEQVACVILEPTTFEAPAPGFLEGLRKLCSQRGVLLVFDEMWTGFRLGPSGAQGRFDVVADLACFSKAVANGMPLSALCGRRDVMSLLDKDVFWFSTFGGECLSLAAAAATMDKIVREDVCRYLATVGLELKGHLEELLSQLGVDWMKVVGFPERTMINFTSEVASPLEVKSLLQQELLLRGVLCAGTHTASFAHGARELEETVSAYRQALPIVARAVATKTVREQLRGEPVEPVFRRTTRFDTRPRPPRSPRVEDTAGPAGGER